MSRRPLGKEQRRFFRDDLRNARAKALADAEAYALPLNAIERLGRFLKPSARGFASFGSQWKSLAAESELAWRA